MQINWSDWFYYDETSPTFIRHKIDKWAGYTSRYGKEQT